MDMEEQLLHLEHFMPSSPGFFDVGSGHDPAHFPNGGLFVEQVGATDDGGWVEELMQLGEELFGGPGDGGIMGDADDHYQQWQCDDDVDGGSPDGGPPPSVSLDGDDASPGEQGAGELASEPHREDGDDVSGATRKRRDRSKTIVSERKRRVRMKEKLYELRSLVPNITKMDKASIIADAVVYVKNLQAHARKLKDEVATLEARPRSPTRQDQPQLQHGRSAGPGRRRQQQQQVERRDAGSAGAGARVTHVGAAQVGDGRFFVTVECERRDGVAAPLCAAAESLLCFRVESSSIGRSGPDRVVSTLTLKVSEQVGDAAIGEASVKHWMMAALIREGFRPEATVQIS
ncbi:transcription factor BHLH156 [Zea mays]|uniref:BHLH domain-containing protein n=1 Tax=Zea mays TaxID=4577 RepID=A0A804RF39_MAIZE|nr:transcription factor BHLH156 [Zea mays]|eukprot:XP_008663139.1 transcription factor FER-LIKE IRON DEFICIENCY-INDUCED TRANSCRIPTION FACTOR [Zea mays]